eukprot:1835309-Pleurochrysis_carterae.AAC.1
MVTLPPAERALYVELKNHLEALDMKNNHKTIKSKCKSENDREARLAQARHANRAHAFARMGACLTRAHARAQAHTNTRGGAHTRGPYCERVHERSHQLTCALKASVAW